MPNNKGYQSYLRSLSILFLLSSIYCIVFYFIFKSDACTEEVPIVKQGYNNNI